MSTGLTRRELLQASAAAGGGLLIACLLPPLGRARAMLPLDAGDFVPNAWLRVGRDDTVTCLVPQAEMGQGVYTSLPMLVAEELEVELARIAIEPAPADQVYTNPLIGMQLTGGSTSVRAFFDPLRKAAATARAMLVDAAAVQLGVARDTLRAQRGTVVHAASGKVLRYGELCDAAAKLKPPADVVLKDPRDFQVIGQRVRRLDTRAKVTGAAAFGLDVKVPGLLIATVARCPVFGGKVGSFEAAGAKAVSGVRAVLPISSGIAVVADSFFAAKRGRDALQITWQPGDLAALSSAEITRRFTEAAQKDGKVGRTEGDAKRVLASAPRKIEAVYAVPFLSHATMEPMNATAHVRADGCDLWVGTQAQTLAQMTAAKLTGLPPAKIAVHTTLLGGGFGRRAEVDFLADAIEISKAASAPVKVVWTREDDMQHDFYRPASRHTLAATLGADGKPLAWQHRIVCPSVFGAHAALGFPQPDPDPTAIEGAAELPYAIPNLLVDWVRDEPGVPVGFWRSVGHSTNAFVTESFLDELASAARIDPFEYRRALLEKSPRHRGVLELCAQKAGWGAPPPAGRFRGIAVHESFASWVAQVAEVSVEPGGTVHVHRVVCAVDCGRAVNPDTIEAQMEGAIVFGLTAALKGEITIANGAVKQRNFNDYEMLRIGEMPEVEVHLVSSAEPPGGVGEPGTPPIAPAVANAIFAATGKRVRELPIRARDLKKA